MGVQISEIIPRREIEISEMKGKVVAIDAFNTLYQFLTTIRQPDGTPLMDSNGDITSHLSGLFYRNINPAIKISVDDGENTYEQWLWAKFPSSPHKDLQLPLRMRFTDFNLGSTGGKYILVAARGSEPWLLFSKKGKTRAEKAILGQPYPFSNEQYSFIIENVLLKPKLFKVEMEVWKAWKHGRGQATLRGHPNLFAFYQKTGT